MEHPHKGRLPMQKAIGHGGMSSKLFHTGLNGVSGAHCSLGGGTVYIFVGDDNQRVMLQEQNAGGYEAILPWALPSGWIV